MAWYDMFKRKPTAAAIAKDRLQIIVARERSAVAGREPGYLPKLQQELLQVIAKYEKVDLDQVSVSIDKRADGEVLELNIVLPSDTEPPNDRVRPGVAFA